MKLSRRHFLGGAGAMISLPMLQSVVPRSVRAAAVDRPRRFVGIYMPNGIELGGWTPATEGADYQMTQILKPLEPMRRYVNVLTGLNNAPGQSDGGGDHAAGTASFLTCAHARKSVENIQLGISIDQALVPTLSKNSRIPSLELGAEAGSTVGSCDGGYSCVYMETIAWADATTPLSKQVNPADVFDRLFSGFDPGQSSAERAKRLMYKKSVLDYAVRDATSLRAKLGKTDQKKLDQYLTSVRELETRLDRPEPETQCAPGQRPNGNVDFAGRITAMIDLIALAFSCDITRVATLMMGRSSSGFTHPQIGITDGHHSLSHFRENPNTTQERLRKLRLIDTWRFEQVARLLSRMQLIQDSDDSNALDNSIVYVSSELADSDFHNHNNMPVMIAGGGGGTVSAGAHRKYSNQRLGNLFVSMLNALGNPATSFGDGNAPLPGVLR